MDFKSLGDNLGLDEAEFTELVELFVTTAKNDLQRLTTACRSGDARTVTDAAHSLKGSSGNLGFAELSQVSKEAEEKGKAEDLSGFDDILEGIRRHIEKIEAGLAQS